MKNDSKHKVHLPQIPKQFPTPIWYHVKQKQLHNFVYGQSLIDFFTNLFTPKRVIVLGAWTGEIYNRKWNKIFQAAMKESKKKFNILTKKDVATADKILNVSPIHLLAHADAQKELNWIDGYEIAISSADNFQHKENNNLDYAYYNISLNSKIFSLTGINYSIFKGKFTAKRYGKWAQHWMCVLYLSQLIIN